MADESLRIARSLENLEQIAERIAKALENLAELKRRQGA